MIRVLLRERSLWLVALIGLLLGSLLALEVINLMSANGADVEGSPTGSAAAASPSPSAAPSPSLRAMGVSALVFVPSSADCLACHLTTTGIVGTRPIPTVGHPLEGWTQCTACHSTETLVKTAPGHTGLTADECLSCHTKFSESAPSRPHAITQNTTCLECHGTVAPLPAAMATRSVTTCWLCHRASPEGAPAVTHPLAKDAGCLSCHTSGTEAGPLPADHHGRPDSECLLCHRSDTASASSAP